MERLLDNIQIHVPFTMLYDTYLDLFIKKNFNPEIYFNADALENYSYSDFNYIAKQIHARGLHNTMHGPFLDLSPGSSDPEIRALTRHRFEQLLKLVPIFKPKTIVCHTGYDWKRYWPIRESWLEASLEIWSWLGERIKDEGGQLVLENVYEHSPDDILILFENLRNQDVGFCLDVGHQTVFGRSPVEKWVETLGPYLTQLHLHDNFGDRDDHLALGSGSIDFPKLFSLLNSQKEKPLAVTIEPHREQDLYPSLEYLKKIWPW